MVNTFIVYSSKKDPEYRKCAKALDIARLRKQILEASQIINIIQDFIIISQKLNINVPKQMDNIPDYKLFLSYKSWLTEVAKKYKSNKEKLYWKLCPNTDGKNKNSKCEQYSIQQVWSEEKQQVVWTTKKYSLLDDGKVKIGGEIFQREMCCIYEKGERAGSLGFYNHPVTRMWVGYLNALKLYHNSHLEEYISRGFKPKNMKPYEIKGEIIHPFWANHEATIQSYRSSLLRKEYGNNEPAWYTSKVDFIKVLETPYFSRGYIWWSNLSIKQLEELSELKDSREKDHSPLQLLEDPKEMRARKRGDVVIVLKLG